MTTQQIEKQIRLEMKPLSDHELIDFALHMGVEIRGKSRNEVEESCVTTELYAFTH